MTEAFWGSLARMLNEQCDGHGGWSAEVYVLNLPKGVDMWVCKSCWWRLYQQHAVTPHPITPDTEPDTGREATR